MCCYSIKQAAFDYNKTFQVTVDNLVITSARTIVESGKTVHLI
jgi:transcription termination factor Rho